ncbi:MAG: STAS domain-containing protein, partial [Fibrobacterota bacterium]
MKITTEEHGSYFIVILDGELTVRSLIEAKSEILKAIEGLGHSKLALCLKNTGYLDSSGVGL